MRHRLGKPTRKMMAHTIDKLNGARSRDLVLGSRPGVDVSVLRIDNHKIMIVSCDPVSLIPSMGPEASARMSVYEVASDVATSGLPPEYVMVDLNLPPGMSDGVLSKYWRSFHETCLDLGVSIVGGHTGRFQGCDYSVIGGATIWSFGGKNDYVTSSMAQNGDDLILTKSAAFGATSVLARAFPRTTKRALGESAFDKAWNYFPHSNTVKDALTAAKVGIHERGVTAMHDATEGGVLAAILELAEASRLGGLINISEIPISDETQRLCRFFDIDPLTSLGEGSLVITARPSKTGVILKKLTENGVAATVVGRLSVKARGLTASTKSGRKKIPYPPSDPYWRAYWNGIRKGWS